MAERLQFSKLGRAKYISHLDLMRTFQRAFARANIPIKHTEGFHPHPFISIALPLSVGFSSECEILEFGLLDQIGCETIPNRLNAVLPEGIVVHRCYPAQRPLKELILIEYFIHMEYDEGGCPAEAEHAMREMLSRDRLIFQKKSKKAKRGITEIDIIPKIHAWTLTRQDHDMTLDAILSAQNPGLNPDLIRAAFCEQYAMYAPDFVTFHRHAVLDGLCKPFA